MFFQNEVTCLRPIRDTMADPVPVKGHLIWKIAVVHCIIDFAHELGQFWNAYLGEELIVSAVEDLPFIPVPIKSTNENTVRTLFFTLPIILLSIYFFLLNMPHASDNIFS